MRVTTHVSRLRDRLRNAPTHWRDIDGDPHRARVGLMQEHLRRSALWARALDAPDWLFVDVAERVDPGVRAPAWLLDESFPEFCGSPEALLFRRSAGHALHFEALRDARIGLPGLPHPFNPLIAMYELGGGFTFAANGTVVVDGTGVVPMIRDHWVSMPQRVRVPGE